MTEDEHTQAAKGVIIPRNRKYERLCRKTRLEFLLKGEVSIETREEMSKVWECYNCRHWEEVWFMNQYHWRCSKVGEKSSFMLGYRNVTVRVCLQFEDKE